VPLSTSLIRRALNLPLDVASIANIALVQPYGWIAGTSRTMRRKPTIYFREARFGTKSALLRFSRCRSRQTTKRGKHDEAHRVTRVDPDVPDEPDIW